jgi:hypothetical protein
VGEVLGEGSIMTIIGGYNGNNVNYGRGYGSGSGRGGCDYISNNRFTPYGRETRPRLEGSAAIVVERAKRPLH